MKPVFVREEIVRRHPYTCRNPVLSSLCHPLEPARAQEENGSLILGRRKRPQIFTRSFISVFGHCNHRVYSCHIKAAQSQLMWGQRGQGWCSLNIHKGKYHCPKSLQFQTFQISVFVAYGISLFSFQAYLSPKPGW